MWHSLVAMTVHSIFVLSFFIYVFFYFSFITYRSCRQLDGKHTIFGKIVGGLETLTKIENIEVGKQHFEIFFRILHVF